MLSGKALVLALLALAANVNACIYKYGTAPDSLAAEGTGTKWDYKTLGDDWAGNDGKGNNWVCLSGGVQSPINIPKLTLQGDVSLRTSWSYPVLTSSGTNLEVINNGHALQVEWPGQAYNGQMSITVSNAPGAVINDVLSKPNAAAGTKTVIGRPAQFHFHTGEHLMFGAEYPIEMHIVSYVDKTQMPACTSTPDGCIAVTGILFEIRDGQDNPFLHTILNNLPLQEGGIKKVPAGGQISIEGLMPPADKRSYFQYPGSLTAPPCLEGLLWHVFDTPSYMSLAQYRKFLTVFNDKKCTPQESGGGTPLINITIGLGGLLGKRHRKVLGAITEHVHSSATSAIIAGMPKYVEINAKDLPTIRRDSEGHLTAAPTSARRSLLTESNLVCVVYAYARNNRLPQPVNNRIIKHFPMPSP